MEAGWPWPLVIKHWSLTNWLIIFYCSNFNQFPVKAWDSIFFNSRPGKAWKNEIMDKKSGRAWNYLLPDKKWKIFLRFRHVSFCMKPQLLSDWTFCLIVLICIFGIFVPLCLARKIWDYFSKMFKIWFYSLKISIGQEFLKTWSGKVWNSLEFA